MTFPITFLFFFSPLLLGVALSISSSSWFGAWIGLELNMMSFIPIISMKMNSYLSESALKYFLIQALASTLLIMSSLFFLTYSTFSSLIILLSLLLKLGASPFHFWFPQVMEGLTWPQAIILTSIQKLAPMFLISYLTLTFMNLQLILISAILSAITGALGGLNLMKLRKIMAFSSINHMSWLLVAITINDHLWMMYFFFYVMISSSVMIMFHIMQAFSFSQLLNLNCISPTWKLLTPMSLLSLGGLPPFTGFIPKWIMIQMMLMNQMFILLFALLLSALVTLYFYLRISIPFFLLLNTNLTFNIKYLPHFSSLFMPLFSFLNFSGLLLPLPFLLF
uniref:NADH-ubiquinone oxidoreductase chain 2 n=1 Tax=Echinoecus nipponicus TaxID=2305783 RepID=A0A346Q1B5_9EUCA|nr:NADH dehydrogenase subunit 2 [Echinoecus nipponicus]AXR86900.1 NADH dehydrogenase subunit 2 [Echinoecus nipponicus]